MIKRLLPCEAATCRPFFIGAATTLAFAPYQLWPIAIISPALLLILIHQSSRAKQSMMIGYAWGLGPVCDGNKLGTSKY